jgi:hypothetical protein
MVNLHNIQDQLFDLTLYITWMLYIAIAFGLSVNAPQYLETLNSYVKIYVSLFLILRFNPFRNVKFTNLDAKIAFSAGVFLLTSTALHNIFLIYLSKFVNIKNEI